MTTTGGAAAQALAGALVEAAGDQIRAVLLYGSRLLDAAPDRYSAYDFVVIVEGYDRFYRDLRSRGLTHRPPRLMAAAARILPPNVISFSPQSSEGPVAKCLIVSVPHFEREMSSRSLDHFFISRMIQQVAVLYVSDFRVERWVEGCLAEARRTVLIWAAPYVKSPLTPESLALGMLEICYSSEIRPESGARARSIFEAQRAYLVKSVGEMLDAAVREGHVKKEGDRYVLTREPGLSTLLRRRVYRTWSKARVTGRWLKHTLTFEGWLPYIVRKVERRTGLRVELSPLERAWPLLFLWPQLIKVLATRPSEEVEGPRALEEGDAAEGTDSVNDTERVEDTDKEDV